MNGYIWRAFEAAVLLTLLLGALAVCAVFEGEALHAQGQAAALAAENEQLATRCRSLSQQVSDLTRRQVEPVEMVCLGTYHLTAYCAEEYPHICGGNGVTASGTKPTPGVTAAADWDRLAPGSWLYIEGVGIRQVQDSGSAIKENRLDILVATHEEALSWAGYGDRQVWLIKEGQE